MSKATSTYRIGLRWFAIIPMLMILMLAFGVHLWGGAAEAAPPFSGPTTPSQAQPTGCDPTWQVVTSPDPGTGNRALNDVAAVSANDVWMVGSYVDGNNGNTLIEHWNGTSISVVTSPNVAGSTNRLYSVDAASANDVWAVGEYYDANQHNFTLIEHWNGSAWSIVSSPSPSPNSNSLAAVAIVSTSDVWAVGTTATQSLILHWNGSAWSQVTSPNPGAGGNTLLGVTAISPTDVWAVGNYANTNDGLTLTLHWNGSAWSQVTSPNFGPGRNHLLAVDGTASNDGWAVGYFDYDTGGINEDGLALHWDGTSWTRGDTANPSSITIMTGVTALASDNVRISGYSVNTFTYRADTFIQRFDGASWSYEAPLSPGSNGSQFQSVFAINEYDVWAVGKRGSFNGNTLAEHLTSACPPPTSTPVPPSPTPTPCTAGVFSDVPQGSTYYPFVSCLAGHNVVGGYSDCTFRPGNPVTRGQLSKIVSLAANFTEDHTDQTFQDVPVGSTFHLFIERLASRTIINGYACGGAGEPCIPPGNKPYFRAANNVTRGQTSKIVAIAKGLPAPTPGQQTFQDVPTSSTFWQWIEELSTAGAINGYACGGAGEPCIPPGNKPYFRAANNVTRGQSSKIVANTFFPNCQTQKR